MSTSVIFSNHQLCRFSEPLPTDSCFQLMGVEPDELFFSSSSSTSKSDILKCFSVHYDCKSSYLSYHSFLSTQTSLVIQTRDSSGNSRQSIVSEIPRSSVTKNHTRVKVIELIFPHSDIWCGINWSSWSVSVWLYELHCFHISGCLSNGISEQVYMCS